MSEFLQNTQGKVWYGLHFYPGVAEYQEPKSDPYRVFLNEETLRSMDPTFAGKPVFVDHVEGVEGTVDELRKEADGWVIESFFNTADGKHWVKFITVSERAERAIKSGMRLSNAYHPKTVRQGGLWNGVTYAKEITAGEYEHLAIVRNPRYEESVILTPEAFKLYNSEKEIELKRLANSHQKSEEKKMKLNLNLFKRVKIENSVDIESTVVELPQSKKEMTIADLVTQMDIVLNMAGYAADEHMVKMDNGDEMSVKDMKALCHNMMAEKNAKTEEGGEPGKGADDDKKNDEDEKGSVDSGEKDVGDRGGDKHLNDDESDDEKKKKEESKKNAADKAKALKNAGPQFVPGLTQKIELPSDKVARGKALFGSN